MSAYYEPIKIGSAFAGIGGFELGVESALSDAGVSCEISWQIEINPFCLQILEKHYPGAQRYTDITRVTNIEPVDLLLAGFPCQDISIAGKQEGLNGQRSGLFFDLLRLVRRIKPRWLLLENVAAILHNGGGEVLRELASIGYDARWQIIQASDAGAPHKRARWFAMANTSNNRQKKSEPVAIKNNRNGKPLFIRRQEAEKLPYTNSQRKPQLQRSLSNLRRRISDSNSKRNERNKFKTPQSRVGRAAHGIPSRLDKPWRFPRGRGVEQAPWEAPRVRSREKNDAKRIKALGNSIVPQCAYLAAFNLGLIQSILEAE